MNCVARIICGTCTGKFVHIRSILKSLHWLLVEFRNTLEVTRLTYKALHALPPHTLPIYSNAISLLGHYAQLVRNFSSSRKAAKLLLTLPPPFSTQYLLRFISFLQLRPNSTGSLRPFSSPMNSIRFLNRFDLNTLSASCHSSFLLFVLCLFLFFSPPM